MKRYLTIAALVVMFVFVVLFGIRIREGVKARRAIASRIATLPEFELATLEGQRFGSENFPTDQPVVLVYFTTVCPYCQSELNSIRQHAELKRKGSFLMISREPLDVLQQYHEAEELDKEQYMPILWDSLGAVHREFGVSIVPSTFIYGTDRRLVKKFTGETSADIIYQVLMESVFDKAPEESQ